MGLLSKIWGGIKSGIRKIGGGIKRLVKKIGGAFGKLGILGHIGMMFLMPYLPGWWGTMGEWATRLAEGTSMAGQAFGHVMRGVYHAGKAVGTVYRGVTEAISGSLKWLGNKASMAFGGDPLKFGKPWEGLKDWSKNVQDWGKEGWTGSAKTEWKPEPSVGPSEGEFTTGDTTIRDQMKERMRMQGVEPLDQEFSGLELDDYRIQQVGGIDTTAIPSRFQGMKDFTNVDDLKSFIMKSQEQGITFGAGEKAFLQDAYTKLAQQGMPVTGELAKKNLLDKAKDFGSDFIANVKEDLSAQGLADAATEGVTGGLTQALGAKVMDAAGYKQPDYISKQVVVPTIQTFQGDILSDSQLGEYSTAGYSYGSHQMNQFYGEIFKDQDPYLEWLNNLYPSENTEQYKVWQAA